MRETISLLDLDLSGAAVLTEAASGAFLVTPVIAVLAGAKQVLALTRDSRYASAKEVIAQTRGFEILCGCEEATEIHAERELSLFTQADIVTNLGFVRPLDAEAVSVMKPGAVIPLMCEAWEYRREDVDVAACRARNIPVMGTFENYDGLGIFDFSGPLAVKMLFEAGIAVKDDYIAVVSQDDFGNVISAYLRACGAHVQYVREPAQLELRQAGRLDALLVACYTTDQLIVGPGGWFESAALAAYHPECTVVQFAGNVDAESLAMHRLHCVPGFSIGPHRMAQTLAALGPKPVIYLHAAGLKVGELMWRKMQVLQDAGQVEGALAMEHPLSQRLPEVGCWK